MEGCYALIMATGELKQQIRQLADQLPDDATIEDAIERLCFLARVERGLADADAGRVISHEELVRRLAASGAC